MNFVNVMTCGVVIALISVVIVPTQSKTVLGASLRTFTKGTKLVRVRGAGRSSHMVALRKGWWRVRGGWSAHGVSSSMRIITAIADGGVGASHR